jgi:hypothetical protein
MANQVGIMLELDAEFGSGDSNRAEELASAAEANGLDLVVAVADRSGDAAGLDPWTTAVWVAGRTEHIMIGVSQRSDSRPSRGAALGITSGPPDAGSTLPSMQARARESVEALAPSRLLVERGDVADTVWRTAPRDVDLDGLSELAEDGLPVVVPVSTVADVERLAVLAREWRAVGPSRPRRSATVRSRRVSGIAYDDVPDSLAGDAVEPGDRAHGSVSSSYLRGGAPGLVLRPGTPEQVADAVAFARRHRDLPIGIRSGGHGISGRSTNHGGLVIDVSGLNEIEVLDHERRLVRVGAGATWKQVAAALHPHGWVIGSGDYGGVGVGGLATAGGIGLLSREHGLTIDHVRSVDLVLADGTRARASANENPDLFWAVRGAGANFGIATAFEFEADEVVEVGWAKLTLVAPDIEALLSEFGRVASEADRDTTVFLVTGAPRQGQSIVQLFAMVDASDPDVIIERLTPFAELGMLAQQDVVVTPYRNVMAEAADVGPDGHQGFGEPVSRSALLPALTPEFARDAAKLLQSGLVGFFQLRTMGGAIADVAAGATAFAHRSAAFQVTAMGGDDAALSAAWDRLRPHFDGLYLSFETELRPERLLDAFPEPTLGRLRALKRRYDPDNVFRDNFNIDPDVDGTLLEPHGRAPGAIGFDPRDLEEAV